jgi:hypothetical protein
MRWVVGLFLIVHGLIHVVIWTMPRAPGAPMDVDHSPLFGDVRVAATVLAVTTGAGFMASGAAHVFQQDWWAVVAFASALASVLLLLLTFTPWWLLGLAIDVVIVVSAWRVWTDA